MDSLSNGSNKLLEIQSGDIYVVIKSKSSIPNLIHETFMQRPSRIHVIGMNVSSIKIFGEERLATDTGAIGASSYNITTYPLFFEQTDYEMIVRSKDGKSVALRHENFSLRDRIGSASDTDDLIRGIVNFGNSVGYSDFEIFCDGKKNLLIRIEVFPSEISCKEDYQDMLQEISNEISTAVWEFMCNTYGDSSVGGTQESVPALFFEIIRRIFDKFQNAVDGMIASPHYKSEGECPIVPARKVKKADDQTSGWLFKLLRNLIPMMRGYFGRKTTTVPKQIAYNTVENQFTKFLLKSTVKKLKDFGDRYTCFAGDPEREVLRSVDTMTSALKEYINAPVLRDVDDYQASRSMSMVFNMAPGYGELYKYYLMMQRGLAVQCDVIPMSHKDMAQLYEYWCFVKLVTQLKRSYKPVSYDGIMVDHADIPVSLVNGNKCEVKFLNPCTGETITVTYEPGEQNIQTLNFGGLPFLLGSTDMSENHPPELTADSSEAAFERVSLPHDIEEKLEKVDWSVKDVMVGTVRTQEQLDFNLQSKVYYAPARYITEAQLPIRYIALYEAGIGDDPGIGRYGEVLSAGKVKRGRIPVSMRPNADPNELYYYFTIREWIDLPQAIEIQDTFRGKPQFTNKFLLDHCTKSYQLFAISSEEEYRLMREINRVFKDLEASNSHDDTTVYPINDKHSVIISDGNLTITSTAGTILCKIPITTFSKHPRTGFRDIKRAMGHMP